MATVPPPATVGIVGLGLMGGSLARELAALGVRILGYDPDPDTMAAATESGVLHSALPESLAGLGEAELLVVAVPVNVAPDVVAAALPNLSDACVITDLGSTKRSIAAAAERLGIASRFVGSHPLTGDHRSGWSAAHRDLYAWSRIFLCPTGATSPEALAQVVGLWRAVGALPEIIDAEEHDRRIAWTSHLPQIVATSLALALEGADQPRRTLGPGGRDTTRLAGSSPEMWSAICVDNADLLVDAIAALEVQLARLRVGVESRDPNLLRTIFAEARSWTEDRPASG